ncbi:uncharacterized protein LOC120354091 [Nilaparvata lugens]|uniref:uncharacterized protein LOC120354091 n=1 Tax=Nilaparvata lugens TaxID=108931 RepID=UPI00193E4666|nr:uncharacterized protein LOC120354091 [Nilaparvata lugens]
MFSNSRTEKIMKMVSDSKVSDTGQLLQEFPASQIETPAFSFESTSGCDSYVFELQETPEVISETGQVQEFPASQTDTLVNVCDSYTIEFQGTPEMVPEMDSEPGQVQEYPTTQIVTGPILSISNACDSYVELQENQVCDFTNLTVLNTDNIDMNMNVSFEVPVLKSVQLEIASGMIIDDPICTASTEKHMPIESTSQDITKKSTDKDERIARKRNKKPVPESWEKNIAKKARMRGEKYVGYKRDKNKIVTRMPDREERTMGPKCISEKCSKINDRHCGIFTKQDRQIIFEHFWRDLNWKEKEVFVSSLVDQLPAKRTSVEPGASSRRSNSYIYYLKIQDEKKIVCKKMFLNTLGINEWMAHNWIKRTKGKMSIEGLEKSNDESTRLTKRSKRNNKKKSQENSGNDEYLQEFFEVLPKLPSHYCRKQTTKLYLEPIFFSKKQLYEFYVSKCAEDGITPVSLTKFFVIFESHNLSLFQPRKDRCDTCCGYEVRNITEEEWMKHVAKKDRARKEKEDDKERAIKEECYVLTMDLEAVKLSPLTKAEAFYYKTKLCCHNFTVYNIASHHCCNYWWNETQADLQASTFASCLIDYLENHCLERKIPIVIYSDGCTYQNRNSIMANALLHFAIKHNIDVEQKYLVKGHTNMECDSVHACIERKLKNRDVHVPADYVTATKEAREKPFPYEVKYLTHDFFKDYTVPNLQYYESIRPGRKSGDPVLTDRVVRFFEGRLIHSRQDSGQVNLVQARY